ncbi:glycoprotein 3-alpha-L-fucosyltransferase A-like [Diorhabda carinulata]|uniref:glycoprotein 3-alpha-L-fucosyltransferase A-like n=1 Tax=Diorhabda carinulata TaxID=1163345 RepID=UPI0025A1F63D|nr:glycoprotein 3-alpha-L-fucosyltransferase A-like [Diorhabda carinulata]XP_057666479.1 glycoprotein 3-alpha-L-fucosyltransferase A-like [Diorhabda carinulata]XP_057666480.1 glycoprotein 3-alpha-L-fucosyltransferase A-like [Diorhabda carinulata]
MYKFSCPKKKFSILIGIIVLTVIGLLIQIDTIRYPENNENTKIIYNIQSDTVKQWRKLRENLTNLSNLGRILFLEEQEPVIKSTKKHQILIWKYGHIIEKRLMMNFSNKWVDPFKKCPVKNCDITYKDTNIKTADIVLVHLHRTKNPKELPPMRGKPDQIWAFLTEESPHHTFLRPDKNISIASFNGIFNWSMSYRMDSDIPVPYGRTIIKKHPEQVDFHLEKRRDVLVAILGSNCGSKNHRWAYVKELKKYIDVDVYGACGTLKCPGHFRKDCPDLEKYLFYLSFENSNCDEYITEKVWWNAFHKKNSIPIVMGANRADYRRILPPNSYIDIDEFANPASLAQYLLRLNRTDEFLKYYQWKSHFEILNEHGYFQSQNFHYCRVCQALNYNEKKHKVYDNLEKQWDPQNVCYPAWNSK